MKIFLYTIWLLAKQRPLAAVHIMQIVAVLLQVFRVGVVERQAVTAGLQLRHISVAFPVFVARLTVRVEPVLVWAFEILFLAAY